MLASVFTTASGLCEARTSCVSGARANRDRAYSPSHPALSRNAQNEPPALSGYKKVSESSFDFFGSGSLIVLGCKLALAVPTVQQAWASSGVRAGDRIVAVNGTAGPAEKLLSLLRRDNKKRRLTLVRPQTEESVGWRDSVRARRKLFV